MDQVKVVATASDGATLDVTEAVQSMYDLIIESLDWGSGFISREEAEPMAELARFCGFKQVEEIDRYFAELQRREHIGEQLRAEGRIK